MTDTWKMLLSLPITFVLLIGGFLLATRVKWKELFNALKNKL